MAAPNILNLNTVTGKTSVANITTVFSSVLSNPAGSGNVYKVESFMASNYDGTNSADFSLSLLRSSANNWIAYTVTVPNDSTFVPISRETAIYLEEGDSLTAAATANNRIWAVCSYEIMG